MKTLSMILVSLLAAGAQGPAPFQENGIWQFPAEDASGRSATLYLDTLHARGAAFGDGGPFRIGGRSVALRRVADHRLRTGDGGEWAGAVGTEDLRGLTLFLAHRSPSYLAKGEATPERVREWLGADPLRVVLSKEGALALFVGEGGTTANLDLGHAFGRAAPPPKTGPDMGRTTYPVPELGDTETWRLGITPGRSIAGLAPVPFVAKLDSGVAAVDRFAGDLTWDGLAVPRAVLDLASRILWLPRQTLEERAATSLSRIADLPVSSGGEVEAGAEGALAPFVGWRVEKVNGQSLDSLLRECRGEATLERLYRVIPWLGEQRVELSRGNERKTIRLKVRRRAGR